MCFDSVGRWISEKKAWSEWLPSEVKKARKDVAAPPRGSLRRRAGLRCHSPGRRGSSYAGGRTCAARSGLGPSIAASVFGIAAFDFLFVPPYYTFAVAESSYFFTFAVMLVVALSMSRLTAAIRDHAIEAREQAARTAALFDQSRDPQSGHNNVKLTLSNPS